MQDPPRILIVDDHAANILLLERILRQGGYSELRGITDPRQALSVFSEFRPDLVAMVERELATGTAAGPSGDPDGR